MRVSIRATAFWGIVLGYAAAAHACGGHSIPDSVTTIPGMGFFRPDLLLLYPILSGTLERPIYSLAGYKTSALAFSIQANLLTSILCGFLGFLGFAMIREREFVIAMVIGLPVISMLIKLWWFNRVPREGRSRGRVGWFLLATLLSTLTIASIPFWMNLLGTDTHRWAERVYALKLLGGFVVFIAAIIVHGHVFSHAKRDEATDARRGFEVLPPTHQQDQLPVALPAAMD